MSLPKFLNELNLAQFDCTYVDVRHEQTQQSRILIRNGEMITCQDSPSEGVFIRVLNRGKWFYASTTQIGQIPTIIKNLIASSQTVPSGNLTWPKREKHSFFEKRYAEVGSHLTTLHEKRVFCEALIPVVREFNEARDFSINYLDFYKIKSFIASDGVAFSYDYNQAGASVAVTLQDGEKRFDDYCKLFFMNVKGQLENATQELRETLEEGLTFINAPTMPAGKYPVVLSPEVTGVFTHESFGHKSEADFGLGDPEFMAEWQVGREVASANVSIVDEGESFATTGYCPIDDEGFMKKKTYLIKNGKLAGRLHNATTAMAFNEENTGNARAINFMFEPIVRMTNTYIEGGKTPFAEMIAPIKQGLYVKDFKHGSGLSTFTIAPSKCWLIENGKVTTPVRVAVLSGSVFDTLNSITGLSDDFYVKSSSLGGCGKGEQFPLPVADGGPSILVSAMQVG